jgi:hypothetical protein
MLRPIGHSNPAIGQHSANIGHEPNCKIGKMGQAEASFNVIDHPIEASLAINRAKIDLSVFTEMRGNPLEGGVVARYGKAEDYNVRARNYLLRLVTGSFKLARIGSFYLSLRRGVLKRHLSSPFLRPICEEAHNVASARK